MGKSPEQKEAEKVAKAEAAEEKAQAKAEEKAKKEAESAARKKAEEAEKVRAAEEKVAAAKEAEEIVAKEASETLAEKAAALGITPSKVSLTGFKGKDSPEKTLKEQKRHDKISESRLENRIAKAAAADKMKPIEKRQALLKSRFRNIKSKTRPAAYSDKNLKAWLEEYELIQANPKAWDIATKNGTIPYVPGDRKKKTPKDKIDGMDLE